MEFERLRMLRLKFSVYTLAMLAKNLIEGSTIVSYKKMKRSGKKPRNFGSRLKLIGLSDSSGVATFLYEEKRKNSNSTRFVDQDREKDSLQSC